MTKTVTKLLKATISERGNGFPDVGDYVAGDDGEVYEVVSLGSRIETGGPGVGNTIPNCELRLADWDDVDDNEPTCSAVLDEPFCPLCPDNEHGAGYSCHGR